MKNITTMNHFIVIMAMASIVAGGVFVFSYPRRVLQENLDAERQMQAQNLEQALEWYMIREVDKDFSSK